MNFSKKHSSRGRAEQGPPRGAKHRYAQTREGSVRAVIFGSDQGVVGQFNDIVADYAIKTLAASAGRAHVWAIGERVHARLADAGVPPVGFVAVPNSIQAVAPLVAQMQIESEAHRDDDGSVTLWVFYNRPKAGSLYEPVGQRLLPLDAAWRQGLMDIRWPTANLPDVIGGAATLRAFVREYLFISLFRAYAESLASKTPAGWRRWSALRRI